MTVPSGIYVARTCTAVDEQDAEPRPLAALRDAPAYVLLGAPGAGKTTAFKHEAAETGGEYVTARDFLTFKDRREWHGKTLYIDGLDERRAGSTDQRSALDQIRAKLDALGRPRFRLSCREADWFGAPDRTALDMVAPKEKISVLRLNPMTDEGIRELLAQLGVDRPGHFLAEGRALGVDGLIRNPQTLELLARLVAAGGKWPTSRTETFDRSCRVLTTERNPEHRLATRPRPSDETLLVAAGRLSAVMLLTGASGYVEDGDGTEDLIPLTALHEPDQQTLAMVSRTSLFDVDCNRVIPHHRHMAEFLGGRYLADAVKKGLPARRVLALLTGYDGGVVSELRGLAAWFAAHSLEAREEVVKRDPLGTVLYGDVRTFSLQEKQLLLEEIEHIAVRDPWTLTAYREMDARWGDLATEDMRPAFEAALRRKAPGEAKEAVLIALLESLARGAHVPGVATLLLDTARDDRRAVGVREMSLDAYLNQSVSDNGALALLQDIRTGDVSDSHDRMLAKLLLHLYPHALSPTELAAYLAEPKDASAGWITHFWLSHVPKESTPEQLRELMDALVATGKLDASGEHDRRQHYLLHNMPGRLLWALLHGGHANPATVFEWLRYVDPHSYVREGKRIQEWFANNPAMFKDVFTLSVEREANPDGWHSVGWRLMVWIGPPDGFGFWCIDQANLAPNGLVATRYLAKAAALVGDNPDWDDIDRRLSRHPDRVDELRRLYEAHQENLAVPTHPRRRREDEEARRRQQAWHDGVAEQAGALDENRANAQMLYDLATVYFGMVTDIPGDGPRERLLSLLLNDVELVDRVIRAFVMSSCRDDLPTEGDVLRLSTEGRSHFLSLPILAGLEERGYETDLDTLRLGLTILLNDAVPDEDPSWYTTLLQTKPDLVAQVLVKSARRAFRGARDGPAPLYRLQDAEHEAVADVAILPVLRAFPTRTSSKRLPLLASLLRVGLARRPEGVPALIRGKLAAKSMDVAQRMYWLSAGLLTGLSEFLDGMQAALRIGEERRIRHVAAFYRPYDWNVPIQRLAPPALALLVRSVGSSYGPVHRKPGRAYVVTAPMEGAELVRNWIDQLGGQAAPEATAALHELAESQALSHWRRRLQHAATAQREVRRNATFEPASLAQVAATLDGSRPANAADLTALTVDVLAELARRIRNGPTSDWRQYWKTGIVEPEHEDTCRDRLLSDLRRELRPYGVRAEPEGRYDQEKRADIKVLGANAAVPIEIKKSTHRALWTALRAQLVAQYTSDAEAEGFGVYLVLWYGVQHCQRDIQGTRPESAEDLQSRLLADLSPVEARKVFVCVLDVADPTK